MAKGIVLLSRSKLKKLELDLSMNRLDERF